MGSIPRHGIPTAEVKLTYPKGEDIPIIVATDWHIGSPYCDTQLLERIMKYADEIGAYFWLNGDLIENATKGSVGDVHEQTMNPNEQMEEIRRLWGGERRGRVIAVLSGNHEGRSKRDGDFDTVRYFAGDEPRLPYLERAGVVSLLVNGQRWLVYGMHGVRGCGRKAGGSVNAIQDMADVVDADIYIHGHHHQANVTKKLNFKHQPGPGFYWKPKWFVNGGTLHRYGGYGSDAAFPATDVGAYCLWLSDNKARKGKHLRAEFLDRAFFSMPR